MTDTVVFIANGFTKDNVRLQPWHYVYELAKYRCKKSDVVVITEGSSDSIISAWKEGFSVIETCFLSVRRQSSLLGLLKSLNVSELWWSTTPRSIAFYPALSKLTCRKVAFITCPLYRWMELLRASWFGTPYKQSKALWQQRFIPRFIFSKFLNNDIFDCVVVQSNNNKNILEASGVSKEKIYYLPVGIDEDDVKPVNKKTLKEVTESVNKKDNEIIFLYMGALRPIRGFDSLIKALPDVVNANKNVRLIVLARGASDEKCNAINNELDAIGIKKSVEIIGGWLTREQVWSYIEVSTIVVLPFLLVPSDVPIAALEALARGTPIVVSPVDGLPELAEERGLIVDPTNTVKFTEALLCLSEDHEKIGRFTQVSKDYIKNYPRWGDVGRLMLNISDDIHSK